MSIKIPKRCSMFWSWHIYWAYTGWYYLYPVNLVNQKMHLAWWLMKFYFGGKQVGISINGDTPIAGWFHGKSHQQKWMIWGYHHLRKSPSGLRCNHHIGEKIKWFVEKSLTGLRWFMVYGGKFPNPIIDGSMVCCESLSNQQQIPALRIEAERWYPWDLSWLKPKVNICIYMYICIYIWYNCLSI